MMGGPDLSPGFLAHSAGWHRCLQADPALEGTANRWFSQHGCNADIHTMRVQHSERRGSSEG